MSEDRVRWITGVVRGCCTRVYIGQPTEPASRGFLHYALMRYARSNAIVGAEHGQNADTDQ